MPIRYLLTDLNGTLHVGDRPIDGAIASLRSIYPSPHDDLQVKFVTNKSKESSAKLHHRLTNTCGFDFIRREDIFSSLSSAHRYLLSNKLRPLMLLDPEAIEEMEGVSKENPNAVLVGLSRSSFNYHTLNQAFRLLMEDEDVRLVAIHKGRYFKEEEEEEDGLSLGPGPFVECLEYATGKKAVVVGKPSRDFFLKALKSFPHPSNDPSEAVMVGDDVMDDVLGAISVGMKAILVQTGKYRKGDEFRVEEQKRNCVASFKEAVDLILAGEVK